MSIHYHDDIMVSMASQISNLTSVYSTVYSCADQRKHQSSASLAFVWGIHRGPVNSPHKCPVTPKMFPFDDVNMLCPSTFVTSSAVTAIHSEPSVAFHLVGILQVTRTTRVAITTEHHFNIVFCWCPCAIGLPCHKAENHKIRSAFEWGDKYSNVRKQWVYDVLL